jgi:MFS family permease
MQAARSFGQRTFASLSVRNYRLFFIGQGISQCGSWMQSIAQGLLVLELTGSGTALGLVIALQNLPVLFFGPWGGVMADRFPKRTILYVTQALSGLLALTVGMLVITDLVQLWMLYVLGLMLGFITVFDNPARQTFVREMVGNERLTNAVSLSSMEFNLARVIGPSIAGVLAATVGLGACFIADGLSYIAVLTVLVMMRADELRPAVRVASGKGQLMNGLRYVRTQPVLLNTLIMMAIVGMFTYEFSVMLPLFAEFTFDSGPGAYASMTAAMGAGAVVGGLFAASRRRSTLGMSVASGALFGASVMLTALMPTLHLAVASLLVVGFFSITFTSLANVTLQLSSAPDMQGRVMSLWSMAFLGTTPIGGPVMGTIGEQAGARWALAIGGFAAIVAAGIGLRAWAKSRSRGVEESRSRAEGEQTRRRAGEQLEIGKAVTQLETGNEKLETPS